MKGMNTAASNVRPWAWEIRLELFDSLLSDLSALPKSLDWLRQPLIWSVKEQRDEAADEIARGHRNTAERSKENRKRQRARQPILKRLTEIKTKYPISWTFLIQLVDVSKTQFGRWKDGENADTVHQAIDAFLERYDREPNFIREEIANRREQKDRAREERQEAKRLKRTERLTAVLRSAASEELRESRKNWDPEA